jgi:REP element-mobilizing transposase RayT
MSGRTSSARTAIARSSFAYLAEAVRRYGWLITACVLMSNHFHLVIETPSPTLSAGMQWLLGSYCKWFNNKHGRMGHLFGDRFHSFLIDKDSYLTAVARYVVLNPVRADMVDRPEPFRWSSCRATAGLESPPEWLAVDRMQPLFGEAGEWQANDEAFVAEKIGSEECLWDHLRHGIFLGTDLWMGRIRKLVESTPRSSDHSGSAARGRAAPHASGDRWRWRERRRSGPPRSGTDAAARCGCCVPGWGGTKDGIGSGRSQPRSDCEARAGSPI